MFTPSGKTKISRTKVEAWRYAQHNQPSYMNSAEEKEVEDINSNATIYTAFSKATIP